MTDKDVQRAREQRRPDPTDPKSPAPRPVRAPLDLQQLDLTVEPVEERISPRETNVFDK
jgi:hypothetical protein